MILIGNKCDLESSKEVPTEKAKKWAEERNLFFMEVSAKTNQDDCVSKAIEELSNMIIKNLSEAKIE